MAVESRQSVASVKAATNGSFLPRGAVWAGVTSLLSAAAWIAILIVHLTTRKTAPDAAAMVYQGVWMGLFVLFGLLGAVEMTRRLWAHQTLLILAGALLVAAMMHTLGAALWGRTSWWMTGMPPVVVIPVAVAAAGCLWMLVAASAPKTRLRYGSVVIVAAAVAIALTAAVNLIAQKDYLRRSAQMIGRFGPSQRMKQLVDTLDQPVRLTCAYTSRNPQRLGRDYGPQLLELLYDIAEYGRRRGKSITVVNAANEFDRAAVILTLKDRLNAQAPEHVAFLEAVTAAAPQLTANAKAAAQQWQVLPPESYLTQWLLPDSMSRYLNDSAREIEALAGDLNSQLQSVTLLDHAGLVEQARRTLAQTRENVVQLATHLKRVRQVPKAVSEGRQPVDRALAQCIQSAAEMIGVIGQFDDPIPANPEDVLRRYAARLKEAAETAGTVAQLLPNVAGQENAELIGASLSWNIEIQVGSGQSRYQTPQDLLVAHAEVLTQEAKQIEGALTFARPEFLKDLVGQSRGQSLLIANSMRQVVTIIRRQLDHLEKIDPETEQFLVDALDQGPTRLLLDSLNALLDQAGKLPTTVGAQLAEEAAQENILIVEVGDQTEIVSFDGIWPEKFQALDPSDDQAPPRVFNGNAALASKLMAMTSKPYAKVIIAYHLPQPDPQNPVMLASPLMLPENLQTLQKRLREANFLVGDWEVQDPVPPDLESPPADELPRVLLVLPSPQFMPDPNPAMETFQSSPLGKVKEVIDAGTPAIFMSCFLMPQRRLQPHDLFGAYLRHDWGVEVYDDYRVLRVVPDDHLPGKFQFDLFRYYYMPLSLFADHPLGRPLRGQRMIWCEVCPIEILDTLPEGVRVEPVLAVPPAWQKDTWATRNILNLYDDWMRRRPIEPDFSPGGDMKVPSTGVGLPLVVAASRQPADPNRGKPVRIVVLGVGLSMMDGYLDVNVMESREGGGTPSSDPPGANADLVVNSVLWVTGKQDALAATGLPVTQPIQAIRRPTWVALWTFCVVLAPLSVVAVGGLVMFIRRR